MLDTNDLALAVDLHRRSYRMLLWLSDRARRSDELVNVIHSSVSTREAAYEWMTRLYGSLPGDTRPETRLLRQYADFFSTYLQTSFTYDDQPTRTVNPCGCYCRYCTYIVSAPALKTRRVTTRDKRRAGKLVEDRLLELAYEEGLPQRGIALSGLLADVDVRVAAAWSTYGSWLIRRCRGQTPGPALLALWRKIKSDPNRSFPNAQGLRMEDFTRAEELLLLALGEASRP